MMIVCHPDNWNAVKSQIDQGEFDRNGFMFEEFKVRIDSHMERDKPTGRYRMRSGESFEKLKFKTHLIEYGPEDLDWLIYAGVVIEERER